MINKRYKIKLDIVNKFPTDRLNFSLSDVNSSVINIEVSNRDKIVDLTNAIVVIGVTDPNNKVGIDMVKVDQAKDGLVSYVIKPEFKSVVGKWQARLMLILGDDKVVTNTFSYEVKPDEFITINEQASIDERFPLLTDMLSRLAEIEATELGRVEAEKQRQISVGNMRTDVDKLISDANKKINDYKSEIDSYRLAKDTEINLDLTQYKQAKDLEINNHIKAKEAELEEYRKSKDVLISQDLADYKSTTTTEIDNYKNSKNVELDEYKTSKDGEIDTYVANKNKELDRYVADKNNDIDNYKNSKDTLINDKLREVDTAEQSRVEAEQQRVTEHADREAFLNSFESQLGQIETDVNELKNNNTGGNANIDDTQVSKDNTWSSDKISTWSMEQDGVFWTEKEDNFISADDTYEYKLREVEVFGDTWQDSDGKNLFGGNFTDITKYNNKTYSKINLNNILKKGTYTIGVNDKSIDNPRIWFNLYKNNISVYGMTVQGNTTVGTKYTFEINDSDIFELGVYAEGITKQEALNIIQQQYKVQLEEGSSATQYEPYHKADLSNIQHAGELYIDEEGQPILDSEGREQYKIEIESAFGINLAGTVNPQYQTNQDGTVIKTENGHKFTNIRNNTGTNIRFYMNCDKSKTYTIQMDIVKNSMTTSILKFLKITTQSPIITIQNGDTQRVKFKLEPYANDILFYLNIMPIVENEYLEIENLIIFEGDYTNLDYNIEDITQTKQTILLPCQLMKVGDVKDRLFWDESKGRYVVEKKVFKKNLLNSEWVVQTATSVGDKQITIYRTQIENSSTTIRNDRINLLSNSKVASWNTILISVTPNTFALLNNNQLRVQFEGSIEECKLWANDKTIYYELGSYELIETNISTPITIQTYNNKTHVYVVNSNNAKASIKAKFPLKTASAVASVKELGLKNSNSIQEQYEVNQNQDNLIDISLYATDEMYMMIEPLLSAVPQTMSERMVSKMVDMYVAMVIRGLKRIEEVPARYREQVKEILAQLEK